jgi:hypothetical protein
MTARGNRQMLKIHARHERRSRTPRNRTPSLHSTCSSHIFTIIPRFRQTFLSTKTALPSSPALAMHPLSPTPQVGRRRVGPTRADSPAATLQKLCVAFRSPPRPAICTPLGLWHGRYGWTPLYGIVQFTHSRQVLTGRPPFFEMTEIAATYTMLNGTRPSRPNHHEVSDRIWRMIERCWHTVPSRRVSAGEVVELLEAELRRGVGSGA